MAFSSSSWTQMPISGQSTGLAQRSIRIAIATSIGLALLLIVAFQYGVHERIAKSWNDCRPSLSGCQARTRTGTQVDIPVLPTSDPVFANGTLGFGKIFVLSMPRRTDKRDALTLAAAVTGLQIDFRDGPSADDIDKKATPPAHLDPDSHFLTQDGEVGCWRGHMNILREVVASGVETALILEDDVDWDVNIVAQAEMVATATRNLTTHLPTYTNGTVPRLTPDTQSHYGSGWDMLQIGHCGGFPPEDELADYYTVIPDDSTVPPSWDMLDMTSAYLKFREKCINHENRGTGVNGTECARLARDQRIVQYATGPMCTYGYAVSRRGAIKMLARLGGLAVADAWTAIDMQLITLCTKDGRDTSNPERDPLHCLTVSPPLILKHKPKGKVTGDSDIHAVSGKAREIGRTNGAVWSTLMNVEALLAGRQPQSQYIWDDAKADYRLREKEEYEVL